MRRKIYLVMTGTIEPKSVPALISLCASERRSMYLRAFKFYINKLRAGVDGCKYDGVVFCENSGTDVSEFKGLAMAGENVEVISAPPEIFPEYLGKNNDFNIVDYAVDNSSLLSDSSCAFMKLTGRYYIKNIDDLIADVIRCGEQVEYYCDLRKYSLPTFHGVHHETDAEARYIYVTKEFWIKNFYGVYKRHPTNCPVENYVWDIAMANLGNRNCRVRFRREAYLGGDEFTSRNAQAIRFWGVNIPPEVYFRIRQVRWYLETFMRHLFPWLWF